MSQIVLDLEFYVIESEVSQKVYPSTSGADYRHLLV